MTCKDRGEIRVELLGCWNEEDGACILIEDYLAST